MTSPPHFTTSENAGYPTDAHNKHTWNPTSVGDVTNIALDVLGQPPRPAEFKLHQFFIIPACCFFKQAPEIKEE
jgi:hypothetical protein